MAVTYNESLASDRDRVRFAIGDTIEDSGPKPADGNFTDPEINGLVTLEGSWQRAVAAAFETLASLWAVHATFNADGMSVSQSDIAASYREQAADWRRRFGSSAGASAGSLNVTRADGYSDDLDNVETDDYVSGESA